MSNQEIDHYLHHRGEITVLVGNPMIHQQLMTFELHPQVKEADPQGKLLFQALGLAPREICAMQC